MPTLHVVALPHTRTTKEYLPCAYTQKVLNLARMAGMMGWDMAHYGSAGSEVACEHVDIISAKEQIRLFGFNDWKKRFFKIDWDAKLPYWKLHNGRAAEQIRRRKKPGDLLLLIAGTCQKPIADALPDMRAVEWGIGYAGTFAQFRVFESYAWMHCVLGAQQGAYQADGRFYDTVIPNSFPAEDFSLSRGDGGYAVYIGRLIGRKGVRVAVEATAAAGIPLKVAGQGGSYKDGKLYIDGDVIDAPHVEYVGTVDVKRRDELLQGAIASFVPTYYVEPFGGVAVEAALCGVPVLTTAWGAMTETVLEGFSGYHCHTLGEFVWGLKQCTAVLPEQRQAIRDWAMSRYTLDAVAPQYDRYFKRLYDLDGKGWYTVKDEPELPPLRPTP